MKTFFLIITLRKNSITKHQTTSTQYFDENVNDVLFYSLEIGMANDMLIELDKINESDDDNSES